MKKNLPIQLLLALAIVSFATHYYLTAFAEGEQDPTASSDVAQAASAISERDALEARIQAKSGELDTLNRELAAKQEELINTKNERTTLQRELSTLEANIAQLKLSIKTDEVSSQKLGLEIDSLTYDIRDIEISVERKLAAMGKIISEIYTRESVSPLVVFLQSGSIAEAMAETAAIGSVKQQLRTDIDGLTALRNDMSEKLTEISGKKKEIELRQKNQVVRKAIIEDKKVERSTVLTETKNKESIYEQEVAELKKQQDALADEIETIENELRAAFDPSLAPSKGGGVLLWPVKLVAEGGAGKITQHYGEVSYLYKGKAHNGLDIGAPVGTPVFAASDGEVTAVYNNDVSTWRKYQYGRYILIKHPNNLTTIYAHLSKQLVSAGATVRRGDLIGYTGNTGYTTGPHLHFGVYWSASVILKSIPPASGLVPVGATLRPEDYL